MNRNAIAIITLQAAIIIALFWALVFYGQDEYEDYAQEEVEEEIASAARVTSEDGAAVVSISSEVQQQSGIATAPLAAASHQPSQSSLGTVLDIQPLMELRTRFLTAQAEAEVARVSIANSRQEYQRLQLLNQDNRNVSDRAVAAAEATWKEHAARQEAASTQAASIRDSMRQQWGTTLAGWAAAADSASIARLLQQQEALLRITLPFDAPVPAAGSTLMIEPTGAHGKAVRASYISTAPQADGALQGNTYYYRAPAANLRAGMRVAAYATERGKPGSGVVVPSAAVIWYANQAWVYQKEDAERFVRRPVSTEQEAGDGWFNAAGLKAGDEVIVRGAQLLLSEEFKYQIKNENED